MTKTVVALPTSPSFTVVALDADTTWVLSGSFADMTENDWEDETRNWEGIGLLGQDSD